MTESKILPVLPLRDIVVFPHMVVPLFVGREKSVRALDEIMKGEKQILLATQKNSVDDDPATDAIYSTGVLATVLQLLKLPDGTVKVLVEGKSRARLTRFTDREDYYEAEAVEIDDEAGDPSQSEALLRAVIEQFENYVKLNKKVPPEALSAIPRSPIRPSWRTRSPPICRSRSPTSRPCSKPWSSRPGWRRSMA